MTIDQKGLELMGVDHPVTKAKRQVKVQDDNRKDNMEWGACGVHEVKRPARASGPFFLRADAERGLGGTEAPGGVDPWAA